LATHLKPGPAQDLVRHGSVKREVVAFKDGYINGEACRVESKRAKGDPPGHGIEGKPGNHLKEFSPAN